MRIHRLFSFSVLALFALASTASAQHHFGAVPWGGANSPMGGYPAQGYQMAGYQGEPQPAGQQPMADAGSCGSCTDGGCYDPCECESCSSCLNWLTPLPGTFASVEYNMWWNKTRSVPPLVTTSPAGTPLSSVGVLPGAQLLFGDEKVGDGIGNGGRLTVGRYLDRYDSVAIAAKFWAFRGNDGDFDATSGGLTNLAMPYNDTRFNPYQPAAYLVGYTPDGVTPFSSGSINIQDRLDMIGFETYLQFLVWEDQGVRYDFVGGYHFLRLDNGLNIRSNQVSQNAAYISPVGTTFDISDTFEGRNQFHGGEIGLSAATSDGPWQFSVLGKMSVGNMRQTILIDGNTVVTAPGNPPDVRNEGLYALGTNQGRYSRDRIGYIPELNAKIGYQVHPNVTLSVGYTFMYINNVVLGGDQVDSNLNLSQTNGGVPVGFDTTRPRFLGFRETDYWVQGINFGVEGKF